MSVRDRMEDLLSYLEPAEEAVVPRRPRTSFQQFVRSRAEQEAATQTGRRKAPTMVRSKIERGLRRSQLLRKQYRLQRT